MPTTTKQEPERRQTGVKLDIALLREFKVLAARNDTTLGVGRPNWPGSFSQFPAPWTPA